jgi:hypothetical protein
MSTSDIDTKFAFLIPNPDTFNILSYKISMVDCLLWYTCYGSLRLSSKFYSKEKRPISKIHKQVQNSIIDKSKHMYGFYFSTCKSNYK